MSSGIVESSSQGNEGQQGGNSNAITRSRLVQRLSASAANLPAFINDLIHTQAVYVVGTEAAAFLLERNGAPVAEGEAVDPNAFSLRPIAHIRPDQSNAETRQAAVQAFQGLVSQCVSRQQDGVLEVGGAGDMIDPQFCLVTLLRSAGEVVAASAVITRCRDTARAQERLTTMQMIAGYFDMWTLKRTSEQSTTIAQSHQHVLQLATAVATAQGFQAAAMNLCNELSTRTSASRVSVGWLKGEKIRVKALSHTEEFDKRQELIVQLERAMEECLDQEEVVQYEPDGTSSSNVTREHQALSRAQGGNTVLSIPLRRQADIIGVLTLEFAPDNKLGPNAAQGLSVAADLLAPQLYDRFENDRWLITKTGISIRENSKKVIGPKHMLAKVICVGILAIVLVICDMIPFVNLKPTYHVNAPFALAANARRYVCAPYEGFIEKVNVLPGQPVKKGDVLFELNTRELRDQYAEAMGRRDENEKQRLAVMNDPEVLRGMKAPRVAEANVYAAKRDASGKEMDVLQGKMDRSIVKADIDGNVLDMGELRYKIGAPVKLGDQLMVIGSPVDLYAELRVPERDIQDVRDSLQIGDLALSSDPTLKVPIKIDRIVPSTDVKEGDTYYKVFVHFDRTHSKWKPEMAAKMAKWLPLMEGQARVDIGNRRLAWIWTHRFIDWTRLHLWSNPVFAPFFK